jgi:hypothetical protein
MEDDPVIDARRRALLRALAAGAFLVPGVALQGCGPTLGRRPAPLAADRSVWRAEGGFAVDGAAGDETTRIAPGSMVETDAGGGLVFVVGETALFARPASRLRLVPDGTGTRLEAVRLERGAALTVFPTRTHRIETPFAVVGIRGTGVYAAVETGRDYVCTCYGTVDLSARADPASRETIASVRHDAPRYVLAAGPGGTRVQPAPFRDHTDEELLLLEALVGREPPYAVTGDAYGMPRRRVY